jgi:pimeloyl-ACP methyl ester carboxylesterase
MWLSKGDGPLVLLCHGFPELWYSWRRQLSALAAAGFHAVAPDMCGYGQTDRPKVIDQYTLLHLVGDRDLVPAFRGMDQVISNLPKNVPKLQKTLILPGCGHWTQQERPREVNGAMIEFLQRL